MATRHDYGALADPLSDPSLPEWATAVATDLETVSRAYIQLSVPGGQNLPTGAATTLTGLSVVRSGGATWSTTTSGVTIPFSGLWLLSAYAGYQAGIPADVRAIIDIHSDNQAIARTSVGVSEDSQSVNGIHYQNAGQIISLSMYHLTGTNSVRANAGYRLILVSLSRY